MHTTPIHPDFARRGRARLGWLLRGAVAVIALLGLLAALVALVGSPPWLALFVPLWWAVLRGWWRARP